MPLSEHTLTLRDGRTLSYAQQGDLSGKPLFFIHGNPGSRLMSHPDESIAESLGARIITMDRPGYGHSSFQPKRRLLDFPDDLAQLADALEIDQFYVAGVSAGGPYTLATAYKLPERVLAAAVVSGAAPFDRPNPYEGINEAYQAAYKMAKWPGLLLRLLIGRQTKKDVADPEAALQRSYGYLSEADKTLLDQPQFREQVKGYRAEATRNGVRGVVREVKILVSPWGFRLEDVQPMVHLWYWEDDTLVPPQMGRYLEQHLPNTVGHFLPGGGHFSIFTHWRAIIQELLLNKPPA